MDMGRVCKMGIAICRQCKAISDSGGSIPFFVTARRRKLVRESNLQEIQKKQEKEEIQAN